MSGLLEPLRLGEEAPAGHSWENVCQWTTLFEALSPLETCLSGKERETSTNYTLYVTDGFHNTRLLPSCPLRTVSSAARHVERLFK